MTPASRSTDASSAETVSGFASTVTSSAVGSAREQTRELGCFRERRRATTEEHGLELRREHVGLERELGEEGVHVGSVLPGAPDDRDEVAVPAAVRAERHVHVEVADVAHR